jgi:hypothetical protein
MSRLFTLLCLAMFTLAAPGCDPEDPKDTSSSSTTAEDSSSGGSSSTGNPDDLSPGDEGGASSETGEKPGTATLATPHITTDETL